MVYWSDEAFVIRQLAGTILKVSIRTLSDRVDIQRSLRLDTGCDCTGICAQVNVVKHDPIRQNRNKRYTE